MSEKEIYDKIGDKKFFIKISKIAKGYQMEILKMIRINKLNGTNYRYFYFPVDKNYIKYGNIYPEFYKDLYEDDEKNEKNENNEKGFHNLFTSMNHIKNIKGYNFSSNDFLIVAVKDEHLPFLKKTGEDSYFTSLTPIIVFDLNWSKVNETSVPRDIKIKNLKRYKNQINIRREREIIKIENKVLKEYLLNRYGYETKISHYKYNGALMTYAEKIK